MSLHPPAETTKLPKKPNYNFEKNRREQDRQKKKEAKRQRKLENARDKRDERSADNPDGSPAPADQPLHGS